MKRLRELEEKLGYAFQHPQYIQPALTHSSYANEVRGGKRATSGWNFGRLNPRRRGCRLYFSELHVYAGRRADQTQSLACL